MRFILALFLCAVPLDAQMSGAADTSGKCSPAVTGNNNQFTINCPGMSKEQGQNMLDILNTILAKELDPKKVMTKLDEILKAVDFSGWLVPGAEQTPSQECLSYDPVQHTVGRPTQVKIPNDHIALFIGGEVVVENNFPQTILKVLDKPVLVVDKNDNGQLAVSMDVYDSDPNPRLIARIENNKFRINPNDIFDMKLSPDKSRLEVIDQHGTAALDIQYLNKNAVRIKAILYFPGVSVPLIIGDTEIIWRQRKIYNNCQFNSDKDVPFLNILPKSINVAGGIILE